MMPRGRWLERAREAWPWVRVVGYAGLFLWWSGRGATDPMHALLLGVFVADIGTRIFFEALAIPFRGLRFGVELVASAVLTWIVWRTIPDTLGSVGRDVIPFAVLGFMFTFCGKSFRRIWQWLVRDA